MTCLNAGADPGVTQYSVREACCLQAGIFEPAPAEEDAIATTTGLLLNCINSGLYMANYNLILPPITEVCRHIGVKNSMVGIIVGACDIATVFGTVGELPHNLPSPCRA